LGPTGACYQEWNLVVRGIVTESN